jgi:hypothetical protein
VCLEVFTLIIPLSFISCIWLYWKSRSEFGDSLGSWGGELLALFVLILLIIFFISLE